MFAHCSSLKSLPDITNWNLIKVATMKYMFYNCFSLSIFPNISFLESKIKSETDIYNIFKGCNSLTIKPDLSNVYIKKSNENNNTLSRKKFFHLIILIIIIFLGDNVFFHNKIIRFFLLLIQIIMILLLFNLKY